jgi:hypothetical protein
MRPDDERVLGEHHIHVGRGRCGSRARCPRQRATRFGDARAADPHLSDIQALQVPDHDQVGDAAGRHGATIREAEVLGGVERGEPDGAHRVVPGPDHPSQHRVDASLVEQIGRLSVVRAERDAPLRGGIQHRQERGKVAGPGGLAHEEEEAAAELLSGLVRGGRLVVRARPAGDVRIELFPSYAGCVAVHGVAVEGGDLVEHGRVPVDDAGEVHDLGEPQHPGMAEELTELGRVQRGAGGSHRRGRHAGAGHDEDRQGKPLARGEHVADPLDAVDVRDLVGIRDHGGRSSR